MAVHRDQSTISPEPSGIATARTPYARLRVAAAAILAASVFVAPAPCRLDTARAQETVPNAEFQIDLLAQGRMALEQDRNDEALTFFETALTREPSNRQAIFGRAQALDALGQSANAITIYDDVLRQSPNDGPALFYRGVARYHLGELEAAEQDFVAALEAGLTLSIVHQRLGDSRYARGDLTGALSAYQQALEAPTPDASVYRAIGNVAYALRDYPAAERAYSLALERNRRDGYAAYYRAWTRERLGRTLDALQDYNLAYDILGAGAPRVAIDRGALLLANGASAAALEDFLFALEQEPNNTDALYGAATAMLDQGQSSDAEVLLNRLIGIAGSNRTLGAAAYFQRGRARLMHADFENAERDLELSISLAPQHADAYFNRAIARARLDDGAGAYQDLVEAAQLRPEDAEIQYALARTAIVARQPEEARRAALRAELLGSATPSARRGRAVTLLALGQPTEALRELDAALRAAPRDAEALRLAGLSLLRLRRYDDAFAVAQRLGARAPRSPAAPLLEAEALIGLGQTERARAALNRARRLGAAAPVITRLASERWMTVARTGGDNDAALVDQGDALAQAEVALDQSIELSGDVDSLIDRARVRILRRDYAAARSDLDRAIMLRPQDARLRFARGDILRRLGRCDDAIRDFDAGLSLDPGNAAARSARASCKLSEGRYLGAASDMIVSWF